MKKKLPVVTVAGRDEAARLADLPAEATVALQDLAGAIKDGLMAFCCSAGLAVVAELMEAEITETVGLKGHHDPERVATRNGSAPGSVVLGGRTVPLRRPRATKTEGGEVHLDSYAAFNDRDLLSQLAVERMLAGVATRRHALVAEPIGEALEDVARGDSRSAISRRFVAATKEKLAELLASDLSVHEAAVLMIDGIMFHECCCVVALLITADGTKIPVGVWEGDTENGTVVKHLLADLVARGLRYEPGLLLVIDGGKALAAGIKRVFGKHALVQRCVLHKRRDVADYLAPELARRIDRQLAGAFGDCDPARGLKVATGLAVQLEREHPSAAASLREGLDDMFTVRRLGASDRLARSLSCTNAIESMISTVRLVSSDVKRRRDPAMVRRWVGTGMIEAQRSFRRIKGCRDMEALVDAVRADVSRRVAEEEGAVVASTKYDQSAA
ncbi:MAG: transposase [Acidimicrobiales bacterium]